VLRAPTIIVLLLAGCESLAPAPGAVRSEVATSSAENGWAVNYPKQRKVLAMCGLVWVFYSDGADAVYRTSADAIAWSAPTTIRTDSVFGHRIALWFDGTFLHYAHSNALAGDPVTYRRGVPDASGAIAWSGPEQVAYATDPNKSIMYPKIVTDSLGRPWLAFMEYEGGFEQPPYDAIVTTSSTADGTWLTAPGFPFTLVAGNTTAYPDPVGVGLGEGRTFFVYNKNQLDDRYYGRRWNGASWDDEEAVTSAHSKYAIYDIVADGDDIHLAFGGGTLRYRRRDATTGWGAEDQLTDRSNSHPAITLVRRDQVIVSWLEESSNRVVARERVDGTWLSPLELADESASGLANPNLGIDLNALPASSDRFKAAVAYTTGAAPPYHVKIVALP
jgi:hypothetical protein